ncbi:hypothetical protein D9M68_771040 [compost metagenome]
MFGIQVAADACFVQFAEVHGERHAIHLVVPRGAVQQGEAGQEADAGAAGGQQLAAGAFEAVGFAENLPAEHGDLVGADDQVVRVQGGECLGLFQGQAAHQAFGGLLRMAGFVDGRRAPGEGQAQAFEQFAAVGGAGCEHQGWHGDLRNVGEEFYRAGSRRNNAEILLTGEGLVPRMLRLC